MIVESVLNERALNAMGTRLLGNRQKAPFAFAAFLLLCVAVSGMREGYPERVLAALAGAAALAALFAFFRRRTVRITLDRLEESTGKREASLPVEFSEEGFEVQGRLSAEHVPTGYDRLDRLVERNGYAFLITKAYQLLVFPLDQFEGEGRKAEFYGYLAQRAPQMKMKVKTRR